MHILIPHCCLPSLHSQVGLARVPQSPNASVHASSIALRIDLDNLLGQDINHDTFNDLERPFSPEEIDSVIKDLPNDKSPGPDGFNNEFIKHCWDIVGKDIQDLINDFHAEKICLESINDSYITLIPKIDCPQNSADFRPISLLNSVLKIITKLLANRQIGRASCRERVYVLV